MLEHKNITTTQIYAKITKERFSHDMAALTAKLDGIEEFVSDTI